MNNKDILFFAKEVFDIEIEALEKTKNSLGSSFFSIIKRITECEGHVILTGIGKPGHICKKLAATFASLGTPAFYLHPAEALHGDLGMITKNDVVIAISYSGESEEITRILPNIKFIGAFLVGITGNATSTLANMCDVVQVLPEFSEACHMKLAPTSSTTAALVYGDALAVVASEVYGFNERDFGLFHPAGVLGKKLILKVKDLMYTGEKDSFVSTEASLQEAIVELSKKGLGIVTVVNSSKQVMGVLTDGDLRRMLDKRVDVYNASVEDVMSSNPSTITETEFIVDTLKRMRKENVSSFPVTDGLNRLIGTICIQTIIDNGIV